MRICKFRGCQEKHYANGWCRTHYYQTHVYHKKAHKINHWGTNKGTCKVQGCDTPAKTLGYCGKHYARLSKFGRTNIVHKRGAKSQGGHQQYPNHSLLKKNRLIKLAQDPICEVCHVKKAKLVHHIDFKKTNHDIENLMSVCGRSCHCILHKFTRAKAPIRLSQRDVAKISAIVHPQEFTRKQIADMFRRDQELALEFHRKKDI